MQLWVELWVGVFSGFRSNLLKNMVGAWDSEPQTSTGGQNVFDVYTKSQRGLGARGFRSCVDHPGSGRQVLRPRGNESPAD